MMNVRRFVTLLVVILTLSSSAFTQPGDSWKNYVTWSFSVKYESNCEATLNATAKLAKHWHIFSVTHDPNKADFIGVPTTLTFSENKNYNLIGKVKESKKPIEFKDEYGVQIYFDGEVTFSQRIKIKTDGAFDINMEYEFQICDENGCLFPPAPDHTFKIKANEDCGVVKTIETDLTEENNVIKEVDVEDDTLIVVPPSSTDSFADVVLDEEGQGGADMSFLGIFLASFLLGFVALLTPCVFPMIPMTVTFFTKQSKTKKKAIINALLYGASIVGIYVILGLVITAIAGPAGLNEMSSNLWMNLFFFAIFIFFAFSFLGAFEIQLPNSWINKADSKADKGGLIGIFFMAFTLSLVSFSCTGPIIGSLLVATAQSGSMLGPAIGMFGFSLALALPFMLFAIFPGWLNSLPQSGGWLNSVKVVLGLLELAIAFKFISAIDQTYHWDILTREIFVAIWVVVFFIIGIYLLGKIRFAHDSPVEKLSVTRFMFAFLSLTFTVYLLPGMWGAPLFLIDGVAPPRTHSEDGFRFVRGSGSSTLELTGEDLNVFSEYRQYMHEVGDGSLLAFHDLEIGKEYAEKMNLPILLDFTGYSCENCRKTESKIWTNDAIRPILQKELVIISLYVDDKERLPESEHVYSEALQGKIKTVGNKWAAYQIERYDQISQPLYIVIDWDDTDLTLPMGYESDLEVYKNFLQKGISRYKERRQ